VPVCVRQQLDSTAECSGESKRCCRTAHPDIRRDPKPPFAIAKHGVDMSSRPTFEQAWNVIADIAKACREFNELQFKYRQLAFSLVLAAYAAIGYFWSSAEVGKKPEVALFVTSGMTSTTSATPLPVSVPSASQSAISEAERVEGALGRLNLIFLGIGLLTAFSALMIYNLDARYHSLLHANFTAAGEFENRLQLAWTQHAPPQIHRRMEAAVKHLTIIRPMLSFYAIASLAALLPWGAFVWSHWGEMRWTTNPSVFGWVFGGLGLIVFFCGFFYGVTYERIALLVAEGSARKRWLPALNLPAVLLVSVALLVVCPMLLAGHWGALQWIGGRRIFVPGFATIGIADLVCGIFLGAVVTRLAQETSSPKGSASQATAAAAAKVAPPAGIDSLLQDAAVLAHANAFADYSLFPVGAAVLANNGTDHKVFAGCNVENASYGLTLCAERNAIAAAVAAGYPHIEKVFVYTDTNAPAMPCGACRQVIFQFGPKAEIVIQAGSASPRISHIEALLPEPFSIP
jgi:cytidine deaminase